MSAEALVIALRHTRAKSATAKLVLLGIANHDGDGGAWPSVSTLAEYALTSPRTVQRAVDELERLGEVKRIVQGGGTRWTADHRRPNLYEFLLRCPPDCDRTKNHRTRRSAGPTVELDGVDPLSTGGEVIHTGDTGVTPPGDTHVTRTSPRETPRSPAVDNQQTAGAREATIRHETWDHACVDGTMRGHMPSPRLNGRCPFCGARRISWEERV